MTGRWMGTAVLAGLVVWAAWGQRTAAANGDDVRAEEVFLPGAAYDVASCPEVAVPA
jgi:hypothetical protein